MNEHSKRHDHYMHSPWLWIPALFAAEAIPGAMVTFVALIMFVQFHASYAMATLYSALLFMPWALKPLFWAKVRGMGRCKRWIHVLQVLIFFALVATALYVNRYGIRPFHIFLHVLLISTLCAWHSMMSQMYYERMLSPREQHLYNKTKHLATQLAVIVTYGVLIIFVGFLEVFFRDVHRAWAMENYLLAGVFFFFLVVNVIVLPTHAVGGAAASARRTAESRRTQHDGSRQWTFLIFFLLVPQSLLFCTRLLYLIAPLEGDGLNCSLQEIGFAQGTIGVTAFALGTMLGNQLCKHRPTQATLWKLALALTLSPVFYYLMSLRPMPGSMFAICCMTALTQLCFGFGLNIVQPFLNRQAPRRYRNTTNFLHVPLVAGCIMLPTALSGMLLQLLGFRQLFLVALLMAVPALLGMLIVSSRKNASFP